MGINHIRVDFARSITRKIDVQVDRLIDYEYINIKNTYPKAKNVGTIKSDALVTGATTLILLLIIVGIIKLVLNG